MPAMLLGDAVVGQIKEALVPHPYQQPSDLPTKEWAVSGKQGRSDQRIVKSLFLGDGELEAHNWRLHAKYKQLQDNEVRCETEHVDDADLVVTAFGSAARIVKTAARMAREEGLKVGVIRPITLFPFPIATYQQAAQTVKKMLCVELNAGQMVEDVRLAVNGKVDVAFYGRPPGAGSLPTPEEILVQIKKHCG
jgi:2-oxoglutarate ferredoxin oxidoreductase subunit alpha